LANIQVRLSDDTELKLKIAKVWVREVDVMEQEETLSKSVVGELNERKGARKNVKKMGRQTAMRGMRGKKETMDEEVAAEGG
jgi:hypothetical protein